MKKKSSIIKLSLVGAAIVIGFILAFCPIQLGNYTFKSFASEIKLGLDLKGGVYAVYEAENKSNEDFESAMNGTVSNLQATLSAKGYAATVQTEAGGKRIRVSVPDINDPKELLKILGSPAEIVFRNGNGETIITGKEVTKAEAASGTGSGSGYGVKLTLNGEGRDAFANATSNTGDTISIYSIIGDEETLVSQATVNDAITTGQAVITGNFTWEQAQSLAEQITSGMMSLTLTQKEVSTVAATLGDNALKLGLIAGAIGIALVILIIVLLYGLFGAVGGIALLLYTVLMIFILSVFPWVQLTLPGIAGIILSIGMAIDGNIIIYERIKDEYRNDKTIKTSAHYGFRKSISAIVDSNITTVLAAIVLLIFGTGAVKGFAVTLLIGIVLAVFSSLVVTRGLINYMISINDTNPKLYRLTRLNEKDEKVNAEVTDTSTAPKGGIA